MKFKVINDDPPKGDFGEICGPFLVWDGENIALMNYYGQHKGEHEWRSYAHRPFREVVSPTHYMEIELPIKFNVIDEI